MLRRAKECKSLAWSVQIAPPKLCQLSFHSSVPSLSALSGALLEILKHLLEIVDDVMIVCYMLYIFYVAYLAISPSLVILNNTKINDGQPIWHLVLSCMR